MSDLAAPPTDGAVVLTFDDASSDHLAVADALSARGMSGVFFSSVGALGTPGHLSSEALRELVRGGHVVGSHGWSHERLDRLSPAQLEKEFVTSRAFLEDLLGIPVTLFAPAGGIGFDSMPRELESAGYVASRSTRWGIHRRLEDRWQIPGVPVTNMTVERGWVAKAATTRRLPLPMVGLSLLRNVLRPDVRTSLRRLLLDSPDEDTPRPPVSVE